ncbi:MAG: hypothetical protein MUE82_12645 [Chloroflexi bacterium]|jgi:hypothetical protein|nr:hypothetical protein [Chloroflexota bacterium]
MTAKPLTTPYTLGRGGSVHRSDCPDVLRGQRAGLTTDEALATASRWPDRVHGCAPEVMPLDPIHPEPRP